MKKYKINIQKTFYDYFTKYATFSRRVIMSEFSRYTCSGTFKGTEVKLRIPLTPAITRLLQVSAAKSEGTVIIPIAIPLLLTIYDIFEI
jgi:hypothetical protein